MRSVSVLKAKVLSYGITGPKLTSNTDLFLYPVPYLAETRFSVG